MNYLLHFDDKIGKVQHYLGHCREDRLDGRMQEHLGDRGAALTREAQARGIGWYVARTWPEGTVEQERRLKELGRYRQHCSICRGWKTAAQSDFWGLCRIQPTKGYVSRWLPWD